MESEIYVNIKAELKAKPEKLTNLDQWLFVAVDTAKSIIDNTSKSDLDNVLKLSDCNSTSQIYSPIYLYLCALVANSPIKSF